MKTLLEHVQQKCTRFCGSNMRQNKGLERGRESIRIERALSFKKQEDGATAIEYALIASIVGLGIVSGLQMLPPALNALFTSIGPYLNN